MVVPCVEEDQVEVGQPSSTLRMRQEHVRERTLVRRGPTWAVWSEGAFATHRGGDPLWLGSMTSHALVRI
jgi:hypothetical protein